MSEKNYNKWDKSKDFKNQDGAVFIEFVLVCVFFYIPIFIILIEASFLIYTYKNLMLQVNRTARYLSVSAPDEKRLHAKCLFKTGMITNDCSDKQPYLPGLEKDEYIFSIAYKKINCCNVVEVKVTDYKHYYIFSSFLGNEYVIFNSINSTFKQVN